MRIADYIQVMLADWMSDVRMRHALSYRASVDPVVDLVERDLDAYCARDPAANDPLCVLRTCTGFLALAHHRLAHLLYSQRGESPDASLGAAALQQKILCAFGLDIHPGAQIGAGLVLDHCAGTVIGETTEIGDHCYILGGVVLGAIGIADNPMTKRHPTIGARTEIGAFARVLGPVAVGDDCFIAPHTVVTDDIPANTRVTVINQLQLLRPDRQHSGKDCNAPLLFGVVPSDGGILVKGHNLGEPEFFLVAAEDPAARCPLEARREDSMTYRLEVGTLPAKRLAGLGPIHLMVLCGEVTIWLRASPALSLLFSTLKVA